MGKLRGIGFFAMLFAPPLVVLVSLRAVPVLDLRYESVLFHLVVVSAIAACAVGVATMATAAAVSTRIPSVVVLAQGCMAVGVLLLGHGLTTPGVADREFNAWVGRFPVLAIAAFATCLGLAALAPDRWLPSRIGRHPMAFVLVPTSILSVAVATIAADPSLAGRPFAGEDAATLVVELLAAVVLVATAAFHQRRWRLGRDPVQFSLALASAMAVGALVSLELGAFWHVSWWDYHAWLLAGFAAAAYAVFRKYSDTRTIGTVLEGAFHGDTFEHIVRGSPDAMRALVAAVEARDHYTHGHSYRVAELATELGQRMKLGPDDLRNLAQGGFLHDVGKIGIADAVLNKQGPLTSVERLWIEEHPVVGAQMAADVRSLRDAVGIIRHHHERLDGTGYPDGLAGDDIPLLARITAVADVWDALTSERSYRPAWEPARALAHVLSAKGTHLDAQCVDVLVGLLIERGVRVDVTTTGDPETVTAAIDTCTD